MNNRWQKLADAVILQAVRDYRDARKKHKKRPKNEEARNTIAECEEFFRSGWFMALTAIDGEALLLQLQEEKI